MVHLDSTPLQATDSIPMFLTTEGRQAVKPIQIKQKQGKEKYAKGFELVGIE